MTTTTRRGVAALAGLGLAAAVVSSVAVASAGAAAPVAAPVVQQGPSAAVVPGNWTLAFDWDCDGSYSTSALVFNANGTWSGAGFAGVWSSLAGQISFTFNGSETTYSGNIASRSVTGINTTFTGLNGCFYLLQAGVPLALGDAGAERYNAAGKAR